MMRKSLNIADKENKNVGDERGGGFRRYRAGLSNNFYPLLINKIVNDDARGD